MKDKDNKTKIETLEIEEMPIFQINQEEPDSTEEFEIEVVEKPASGPDLTSPPAKQEKQGEVNIPVFVLSLLKIADQAKIIHFQANTKHEHIEFGNFYDEFIELTDDLVESILGKYGIDKLLFGEADIFLTDRDLAISRFFNEVDIVLREQANIIFDKESDNEIFAKIDEMLMLKNKTQYLLQFK